MTTRANIADLTPDELRRRIAEKRGYTIVPYDDEINRKYGFPESTWQVIDLAGRRSPLDPDITTIELAWEAAMHPVFDVMLLIPDWPGDLNTAIELLPIQREGNVMHYAETPTWVCIIRRSSGLIEAEECGITPALAVSRAWLAWEEREGDHA